MAVKVLRIINRFNLGGPTYNAVYLTKHMQPAFDTLLVGGEKDESEGSSLYIAQNEGLEPIIIPQMKRSVNPLNDIVAFFKLVSIIRKFKPQIVHTHASKAGTLGRLAAWLCGVPVIIHTFHGHVFHSYFGGFKTAIYKMIERFLAKRSSAIIAISEKQKTELTKDHGICSEEKMHVIPLGFDLLRFHENKNEKRKSFRSHFNLDDDELAIVIIGRLVPVKNHDLFLRAIKYVKSNYSGKIRAFIVGDGELRADLMSKCVQNELDHVLFTKEDKGVCPKHTVTFTSWIKEADWACAGADVIALTSFNEGTPVSLIEAQAADKPIVSTRVGGVENVVSMNSALLSDVNDPDEYVANLLEVCKNPGLRDRMSKGGWDFVKDRFHYTRLTKDVAELYNYLLIK